MTNYGYQPPYGVPQPGSAVYGGGGRTDLVGARDILDAKRMMQVGQVPSAAYPDGYLGNVNSRRSDRLGDSLLNKVHHREKDKQYQRGVHKGEKIPPRDYYWTAEIHPMAAIEAQMQGRKWTQGSGGPEGHLVNYGKTAVPTPAELGQMQQDERRRQKLREYRPDWR